MSEHEDSFQVEMDRYYQHVREEIDAWNKRWPNACTDCHGWGVHVFYSFNRDVPDEQDPCNCTCEDRDAQKCPRCGAYSGLTEDAEGPCRWCAWNYDDGAPTLW